MKKILVVYATAGIGHKKAAVAVKKALDEMRPADIESTLIDALDYTPGFFKWSYLKLYLFAVNKIPRIWGFMYYLTNNFYVNLFVSCLRRFNNWLNSKIFVQYLIQTKPDVIVSTHFFASEVISDLKKGGVLNTHLITVITDYRLHSWWVASHIDTYIVSNDTAKGDLIRWNVPESRIKVMGIPIEPVFSKKLDAEDMRRRFKLEKGVLTALVIGGGFGVGPIEDIVKSMGGIATPLQIIVICGHNEELVKRIESLMPQMKARMKIFGFVDNVYEFMEVSDILISKAGGITVSESLARNLPMIVIAPIPGQETGNSNFLTAHGAALELENTSELSAVVEDLAVHPDKLQNMKESIRKIKTPRSSYDVSRLAIELARGVGHV